MTYTFIMSDNSFLDWLHEVKQNVRYCPYAFVQPNVKEILTVEEVAKEIQTSEDTIRDWINSKQLKASNAGTQRPRYLIQRDDLNRFLKSRQPDPQTPKRRKNNDDNEFKKYRD